MKNIQKIIMLFLIVFTARPVMAQNEAILKSWLNLRTGFHQKADIMRNIIGLNTHLLDSNMIRTVNSAGMRLNALTDSARIPSRTAVKSLYQRNQDLTQEFMKLMPALNDMPEPDKKQLQMQLEAIERDLLKLQKKYNATCIAANHKDWVYGKQ